MPLFDLPLDQLQRYRAPDAAPPDFDAFWERTLSATREHPLNASFAPVAGLQTIESFDVTFAGYGGQPIKGWLQLPRQRSGPLPCVVEYIGYGGGRGFVTDWLVFASAGYAHFVMDTRGQGSAWSRGDTPDNEVDGGNPQHPGFLTRGVLNPETYYYRRLFTDAVRAVEAARTHPAVDASRVAVTGVSQGGGITLAAAGLVPDLQASMPDVPFLCNYRRATEIVETMPYYELTRFLLTQRDKVDQAFGTLGYFDGVHFAARAQCQTLFSVGLMDTICPPSTVYAAYNAYAGPKQIVNYPYNNHEGGGSYHVQEKLRFLRELWG